MGEGGWRWPQKPVGRWAETAAFGRLWSGRGKEVGPMARPSRRRRRPGVAQTAPIPLDTWLDDPVRPLSRWRWEVFWHDAILDAIRGHLDLASLKALLPTARRY